MVKRSFVFLQGPYGPFFRELGKALERRGHDVARINFNYGDYTDWNGPQAISFRGTLEEWPLFLENFLIKSKATDLLLFNDTRPIHNSALLTIKNKNIRPWVFEEGYLRPYWITIEIGGVNGNSSLPHDINWYKHKAKTLIFIDENKFQYVLRNTQICKLRYYISEIFGRWKYPHYKFHRELNGGQEILCILRRRLLKPFHQNNTTIITNTIIKNNVPFFLLCLQLDHDSQIKIHSPFTNMKEVLEKVCSSFANFAPRNMFLLIKNHPLGNGRYNHKSDALSIAESLGISDRVFFIEYGNLPQLLRLGRGAVVINSTVGPSALFHNCPVVALGKAIYDMEGLTHQNGLDSFWTQPQYPNPEYVKAFRTVLANTACINGCYFTKEGRQAILPIALDKLTTQ
ncbi:MAG: capsular biosynthesis protein [Pseudomonadota bacterium]